MSKDNDKNNIKWYDNARFLSIMIIICILTIIISSQSFAVIETFSLDLVWSIINHNSMYFVLLIYFIFINLRFGKRYFNYLNAILIFLYLLVTVTSFLTIISSFSLTTVLTFTINFTFSIYLIHTLLRGTRIWSDYHFDKSPFNELTNEWYFCTILVLTSFLLAVKLISTTVINGVVISILDSIYCCLFARYIYLYREFLDHKKIDSNNSGNFDEVRDSIQEVLDKTEIDDKIVEVKDKVAFGLSKVGDEIDQFIDNNHINKKVNNALDDVSKIIIDDNNTKKKTIRKRTVKKDKDKVKGDE